MSLSESELKTTIKQITIPFLCNHLESILLFYRYSKKSYSEEIKFIAKLFDLSNDFSIEETMQRIKLIKKLIKANAIYETIDLVLKKEGDTSTDKLLELKKKCTSGMIPLFKINEFNPIKMRNSEVYSWGNINFNISAIKDAINKNPRIFPIIQIQTEQYFWNHCHPNKINKEVALNTNLKNPLLLIEYKEGSTLCIDGQHRLYKAHCTEVEFLPAYYIKAGQFLPYFYDTHSYKSFIEYWNRHLFAY